MYQLGHEGDSAVIACVIYVTHMRMLTNLIMHVFNCIAAWCCGIEALFECIALRKWRSSHEYIRTEYENKFTS